MKKLTLLLSALFMLSVRLIAQVLNPGFELSNSDGSISNWGATYLFSVTIDSNGISHEDSIVFDHGYFYSLTTNAHSGSKALEITNAYNYTGSQCIVGMAGADEDSIFSAYGTFDFVPTTVAPSTFSFYYKYFPLNNDSGVARLTVYDSFMNETGAAEIVLTGTHSSYTFASAPVVMTAAGNVGFISVTFKNSTGGHPATFGTRMLIDDIGAIPTSVGSLYEQGNSAICFPSPALGNINVSLEDNNQLTPAELKITDIAGRTLYYGNTTFDKETPVSIDVSNYPAGQYVITIYTEKTVYTTRFIK